MANPDPPGKFEEGNNHAVTHGLYRSDDSLRKSLNDEEWKMIGQMSQEFLEKYQDVHGEDPGVAEREMIKNLVFDTLKRKRANEYMFSEGEYINFDAEQRHNVYSRIRRDNREEMEALGLLATPEARKQEKEATWFEAMSDAEEADDSIEVESTQAD